MNLRDLAEKALEMAKAAKTTLADVKWMTAAPFGPTSESEQAAIDADAAFSAFAREALPKLAEGLLKLEIRNATREAEAVSYTKANRDYRDAFKELEAKLAIATEALEKYANPNHWDGQSRCHWDNALDRGDIAREALEATK